MLSHSEPLRSADAARYIGISPSTLAKMRTRGNGPVYVKAGHRVVLYLKDDIDAWLSSCRRRSTAS